LELVDRLDAIFTAIKRLVSQGDWAAAWAIEEPQVRSFLPLSILPHAHGVCLSIDAAAGRNAGEQANVHIKPLATLADTIYWLSYTCHPADLECPYLNDLSSGCSCFDLNAGVDEFFAGIEGCLSGRRRHRSFGTFKAGKG